MREEIKGPPQLCLQEAQEVYRKAAAKHKLNYGVKARSSVMRTGDRVLVKNAGIRSMQASHSVGERPLYSLTSRMMTFRCTRRGYEVEDTVPPSEFLLPFMCLPCFDEEEELEDPLTPQEDQAINILDEMQSVDAISDMSSDPGSEAAYDGGISAYHPVKLTSIGFRCSESVESQVSHLIQQRLKTSQVHSPVDLATSPLVMRIIVHVLPVLDGNLRGCSQMTGYLDNSTPLLPTCWKIMCHKVS